MFSANTDAGVRQFRKDTWDKVRIYFNAGGGSRTNLTTDKGQLCHSLFSFFKKLLSKSWPFYSGLFLTRVSFEY
jgi:hypothetical protein